MKNNNQKRPNTGGNLLPGAGHAGVHQDRRKLNRKTAKQKWQKELS